MFSKYYPDWYVDSVFKIDFQKLFELGYNCLVFDIDNTLVHHGDDSTTEVDQFMQKLKSIGFSLIFLSDNSKERIERFNKNIQIPYICEAGKPSPKNYIKALEILGAKKEKTIVIGDQIFKDILGANNSGIKSILVRFIKLDSEKKIGLKRYLEKIIMFFCKRFSRKFKSNPNIKIISSAKQRKLFCQRNLMFYKISVYKETFKRHIKNIFSKTKFAKIKSNEKLPYVIYSYDSQLIKRGKGIDISLQQNKAVNINLASNKINGILIKPGEVFSFWKTVGKTSAARGYKKGRVLINNKLTPGTGGGLCNLAHTINQVVLHSSLDFDELHFHSDCLAPEKEHKVFSSGTSVDYNYIDYRFTNKKNYNFQLLVWCDEEKLYAELRSEKPEEYHYDLTESNRRFKKENEKFYCLSEIYREKIDSNNNVIEKKLLRKNHSEVMYDYSQIPQDLISET